jgi:hypothetical protein
MVGLLLTRRAQAIAVTALAVTGIVAAVTRPAEKTPDPVRLMSAEFPVSLPWHEVIDSEATAAPPSTQASPLPRQLIVPDVIAAVPTGITQAQLASIGKIAGVRSLLALNGGRVTINGKPANVIGVSPQALRAWTPPQTAADTAAWTGLAHGDLLTSTQLAKASDPADASQPAATPTAAATPSATAAPSAAATSSAAAAQPASRTARVTGATRLSLSESTTATLGIAGVDAVVDQQRSRQLGLVKNLAVLINAPGADLTALMAKVSAVLGSHGHVVNLVQVVKVTNLPVAPMTIEAGQVPTNYLALYKESAAEYCPGLSWTVLAAIGEIESGEGANDGPSSAGALGPMQFMPGTWAMWGMDGFGQTGPADIMNPLDAVPSAANMLCADGATNGIKGLTQAIFDYNHAVWYVDEVLELASEYANAYTAGGSAAKLDGKSPLDGN